jgi:hypothetical protein
MHERARPRRRVRRHPPAAISSPEICRCALCAGSGIFSSFGMAGSVTGRARKKKGDVCVVCTRTNQPWWARVVCGPSDLVMGGAEKIGTS